MVLINFVLLYYNGMNLFKKSIEYSPIGLFKKASTGTINTLFSKNSTRDNDPLGAILSEQAYICGRTGSMNDDCIDDINKNITDEYKIFFILILINLKTFFL